jgi:hypothetical protein
VCSLAARGSNCERRESQSTDSNQQQQSH